MIDSERREALWAEHRAMLFGFVRSRVADEPTAEDIVHDVLVRAYGNRASLKDEGKMAQWLYQITRNALTDHYRSRKPTLPLPPEFAEEDTGEERDARGELAQCLRPFIDSLPDHYREAVELSEIRGLTQRETADRLGLSLSGAKSRVQRARRLLADLVLECCHVDLDSRGDIMDYRPARGCAPDADASTRPCSPRTPA